MFRPRPSRPARPACPREVRVARGELALRTPIRPRPSAYPGSRPSSIEGYGGRARGTSDRPPSGCHASSVAATGARGRRAAHAATWRACGVGWGPALICNQRSPTQEGSSVKPERRTPSHLARERRGGTQPALARADAPAPATRAVRSLSAASGGAALSPHPHERARERGLSRAARVMAVRHPSSSTCASAGRRYTAAPVSTRRLGSGRASPAPWVCPQTTVSARPGCAAASLSSTSPTAAHEK